MAMTWKQVTDTPDYQKADGNTREAMRNQYFLDVVAPQVDTEQLDAVRSAYDADTKPTIGKAVSEAVGNAIDAIRTQTKQSVADMAEQAQPSTSSTLAAITDQGVLGRAQDLAIDRAYQRASTPQQEAQPAYDPLRHTTEENAQRAQRMGDETRAAQFSKQADGEQAVVDALSRPETYSSEKNLANVLDGQQNRKPEQAGMSADDARRNSLYLQATGDNPTPEALRAWQDEEQRMQGEYNRKRDAGEFARDHHILSGLKSGGANLASSIADIPQFANDLVNGVAVNPFLRAMGLNALPPAQRFQIAKDLDDTSKLYRPEISNKKLADLKGAGEWSDWIATQAAIQAPQMIGMTSGAFIPKLRNAYLGILSISSGANQYQQDLGDGISMNNALKDGVTNASFEVLGEMLGFKAFDKFGEMVRRLPPSARAPFISEVLKKTIIATTAVAGQHAAEGGGEALTQLGQNLSQKVFTGKDIGLMDGVPEAGAIGAIMATPMAIPHAYGAAMAKPENTAAAQNGIPASVVLGTPEPFPNAAPGTLSSAANIAAKHGIQTGAANDSAAANVQPDSGTAGDGAADLSAPSPDGSGTAAAMGGADAVGNGLASASKTEATGTENAAAGNRTQADADVAPFKTPHEERAQSYIDKAVSLGVHPDIAKQLAPEDVRDDVTGFFRAEERAPTILRAQKYAEETGQKAHYVDADLANLGGINTHFKNNHAEANAVYREMTDIFHEEIQKAGDKVIPIRHGGDEFSAVVIGGNSKAIKQATDRARARVAEYAAQNGLDQIEHPKHPGDLQRRGIGVYFGQSEIKPGMHIGEIIKEASKGIDAGKNGGNNVSRDTSTTPGAGGEVQGRSSWILQSTPRVRPAAASLDRQVQSAKQPASQTASPAVASNQPASHNLLGRIRQLGGVNLSHIKDITGESSPRNTNAVGVFSRNGQGLDDLATQLAAEGFPIDLHSEHDNGGVNQLSDLIRRAVSGEKIQTHQATEAGLAKEQERAHKDSVLAQAKELGVKTVARKFSDIEAEVIRSLADKVATVESELSEAEYAALDELMGQAQHIVGDDTASAIYNAVSAKHPAGNTKAFFDELTGRLQGEIHDYQERAALQAEPAQSGIAEESDQLGRAEARAQDDAVARPEARPSLELASQTEAELKAKEAQRAKEEATARQRDAAPSPESFTLTGSNREADVAAAHGQQSLLDHAAHAAATSPHNDTPQPTQAQIEAGNYKKGHITISGIDISIENPAGSTRSGTDGKGQSWKVKMKAHYGYIKGTIGKDKDHIDVFVKPGTPESYAGNVFVIDQKNKAGGFDEHKVIIGVNSMEAATALYNSNYTKGWDGILKAKRFSMEEFKDWIENGNHQKPASDYMPGNIKLDNATAPEHVKIGVDDRELGQIAKEFRDAQAAMNEDDERVTNVFQPPAKNEITRLADKVKIYNKKHGWMTPAEAKKRIEEWKQHAQKQGENDDIYRANSQKVVLSLFDLSGEWSKPWEEAGYQVFQFDIQSGDQAEVGGEVINTGDINNFSHEYFADLFGSFDGMDIYAVMAATPCTDFAVSGARHFAAKDADGRTIASVKLVHMTLATIEYFKPAVWAIENPVGRIEELGGLPPWRLSFDPNHLGDPYTKKTLLWGRFNSDLPIAPVEPTEGSKMHRLYGGKSQATKNARSVTPEGFSYGFFMANNAHDHPAMAIANKYDMLDRGLIDKAVKAGVTEQQISEAVDDHYYMDLDYDAANDAIKELIGRNPDPATVKESLTAQPQEAKPSAQSKKLEVIKAQAQGRISGDQGAALKELADVGEHAAVDEVLKPETAKQPILENGANQKIDDFGEKLEGAKKDLWQSYKKAMSDELPQDAKDITLAKHFPEPDYEGLIANGTDVHVIAAIKAMRDEIPAKPRVTYKVKRWAEQLKTLRAFSSDLIDGSISYDKLMQEMGKVHTLQDIKSRIELYAELGYPAMKSAKGYEISGGWTRPGQAGEQFGLKDRNAGRVTFFNTRQDAVDALREKLAAAPENADGGRSVKLDIYRVTSTGEIVIGKKVASNKYIDLKGGFTNTHEAREYLAQNEKDLLALLEKKKEVRPERRSVNNPRVGKDYRLGEDVTPEKFAAEFGFRGVQFGNYVEQARRGKDLNNAYDALLDLSNTIGVPPRALSLNGSLGLAFGARGSGGKNPAAAHFEPGNVVINLTKANGAGTLGHEWFHAMDNYFSRMRGTADGHITDNTREKVVYGAGNKLVPDTSVRPEVLSAFKELMTAIRNADYYKRSKELDSRRSKDYWSTNTELGARAFESYLISKAEAKGESNDYLANIISEEAHNVLNQMSNEVGFGEEPYPFPTKADQEKINPAFDNLFQTLKTKETDNGIALFSQSSGAVPESQWLSVGTLTDEVEQLMKPFATEIPVVISDRTVDAAPSADNGVVASGVLTGGKIHLIREGLADRPAVVRTLWHELLHFGLRRFMTKEQYIAKLGELYMQDGWVRNKANAWMASPEGVALAQRENPSYVRARAVDEALAGLAEIMQTEPTGYQNNTLLAKAKRAVSGWVAKLADFFGFKDAAIAWRDYAAQKDARDLIVSTFSRLRSGEAPAHATRDWNYSDPAFMVAWHGSPHDHNKFDSSKIGTGEGAQVYGHGLYFAVNKEVAEWYRNNLSNDGFRYRREDGSQFIAGQERGAEELAATAMLDTGGNSKEAIAALGARKNFSATPAEYVKAIRLIESGKDLPKLEVNKGRLYQVELAPKEDEYLLWDKPLAEQSMKVKKSLGNIIDLLNEERGTPKSRHPDLKFSGSGIYGWVSKAMGGDKAASQYLHSIGIRGIKYLDGSSRRKPYEVVLSTSKGEYARNQFDSKQSAESYADEKRAEGFTAKVQDNESANYNYVIFNDADVHIKEKFSKGEFGAAPETVPADRVRAIASEFSRSLKHGKLIVVDSVNEIPELVAAAIGDGGVVEGAYVGNGRAYIVADAFKSEQRVYEVVQHELSHMAAEELLDTAEFKRVISSVRMLLKAGNPTLTKLGEEVDQYQPDLPEELRVKEILAKAVETGEYKKLGALKNLMADLMRALKRIARSMGINTKFVNTMTEQEVMSAMRSAMRALYRETQTLDEALKESEQYDQKERIPRTEYERALKEAGLFSMGKSEYDQNQGGEENDLDFTKQAGTAKRSESAGFAGGRLRNIAGLPPKQGFAEHTKIRSRDKSEPLVIFRGSRSGELTQEHFGIEALGHASGAAPSGRGVHFTDHSSHAANFGKVYKYHVDIRNPFVFKGDDESIPSFDTKEEYFNWREGLRAKGYDGIVEYNAHNNGANTIIAFDPHQVIPVNNGPLFSRGAPAGTQSPSNQQRPGKSLENDISLTDRVMRLPFKAVGWNAINTHLTDRVLGVIGDLMPEHIKAGMVDNYGLDDKYIDSKDEMKAREAAMNRKAHGMIEMLAGLTRAESRVAYYWMQEKPGNEVEQKLMEQLPEQSREVLAKLKQLISDMGKEAVRLGQLSPEAYARNNMAYLNRTYAEHVFKEAKGAAGVLKSASMRLKGDQYKGRGVFDEVPMSMVGGQTTTRKLVDSKADKQLVGEKLIRLERRDASTEAMDALPGMSGKPMGKLRDVVYWPASEPMPAKYGDWVNAGTFEVRDTKGGNLVAWRDLTREERSRLGELDEVRYAVAQTLQMMVHNIELGRFFEWTAKEYGRHVPEGREAEASESMLRAFAPDEWVQVPTSNIPNTKTRKYGAMAGLYVPGPVWNDIRQQAQGDYAPWGKGFAKVLQFWKKAKTVWSPGVHVNNVMANFVMADWNDMRAVDLANALRVWAFQDDAKHKAMFDRFQDSGALGGMFQANEVMRDEIKQRLAEMKEDLTGAQEAGKETGTMAKVLHLMALATAKPFQFYAGKTAAAYQAEDALFRLAVFLKAVRHGKTDIEAGRMARHAFLNYDINAPYIQAMRQTVLPFVSFFYRAAPMLYQIARHKPWKVAKLVAFAYILNALGYAIAGGGDDEDRDRALLPEQKRGNVWGLVPKMIRMPWNDGTAPVFLDVRRWVPVGDIVDMDMGAGILPPWATPAGFWVSLGEVASNHSMFTKKDITTDTDSFTEAAEKRLDYLFKSLMPNVPVPNPLNLQIGDVSVNPFNLDQGSFQSYGWSGIEKAVNRVENRIGEVRSLPAALGSSVGIKVGAYPRENMLAEAAFEANSQKDEIMRTINKNVRDYSKLEHPTPAQTDALNKAMDRQRAKLKKLADDLERQMNGR